MHPQTKGQNSQQTHPLRNETFPESDHPTKESTPLFILEIDLLWCNKGQLNVSQVSDKLFSLLNTLRVQQSRWLLQEVANRRLKIWYSRSQSYIDLQILSTWVNIQAEPYFSRQSLLKSTLTSFFFFFTLWLERMDDCHTQCTSRTHHQSHVSSPSWCNLQQSTYRNDIFHRQRLSLPLHHFCFCVFFFCMPVSWLHAPLYDEGQTRRSMLRLLFRYPTVLFWSLISTD